LWRTGGLDLDRFLFLLFCNRVDFSFNNFRKALSQTKHNVTDLPHLSCQIKQSFRSWRQLARDFTVMEDDHLVGRLLGALARPAPAGGVRPEG
jgi:hypothetical protein